MTQAFNLGQLANKVNTSGQLDASTGLVNSTAVVNGGTGRATLDTGKVLLGAGTSQVNMLAGTATNDVLLWSGSAWISSPVAVAGAGGGYQITVFTSPGTYTKPASLKAIKVTVVGAGGNGANAPATPVQNIVAGGGGGGGAAIYSVQAPSLPGPQPITAGAGTNSFGAIASATAGSVGNTGAGGISIAQGGAGGVGSGGSFNIRGASGNYGTLISGANSRYGGVGGSSIMGGGGNSGSGIGNIPGSAGGNYGGGGGGAVGSAGTGTGGAGAPGIVIIEEFF